MQEIEKEIYNIILNNDDYVDILNDDNRWEILYNLSSLRQNILEWYSFDENASLLEVGAEYGALTSLFCKKVGNVVSLCDNDMQKEAIEYRCKAFSNIKVVNSLQEVKEKFDYITIVNPKIEVHDLLNMIMNFLKPEGKIFIACDNGLALKYFLDNDERNNSICVSRKQIKEELMLKQFNNINFYYPLPDFRLPNVIYSEKYLPHEGDVRNVNMRFDYDKYQFMNEDYIYDAMCDEGIYEEMANSFLIIASR